MIVYYKSMRRRDDAKQDAIVEAAIQLINENGFSETSISKIAKAAGVSPATIYIYFENKQDLLNKLYLLVKQELSHAVRLKHDPKKSWEVNFKETYRYLAGYIQSRRGRFQFLEQCNSNPMLTAATRETGMRMFEESMRFFEQGIEEGVFKSMGHDLIAAVIFAPLMQAMQSEVSGDNQLDPQTLGLLGDCAWDAIKA
jgi:AcrR family transcriptional regulator